MKNGLSNIDLVITFTMIYAQNAPISSNDHPIHKIIRPRDEGIALFLVSTKQINDR